MSGGVDSAVALLRAGPHAIGVTLRLWTDPAGPRRRARVLLAERRDRGTRGVPPPRAAARDARPPRGVPPRDRRRRSSAATRAARRRTRASRATAASASQSCSPSPSAPARARLATGHYARIVRHRGRLLLARAADPHEGPELHARAARPALPRPALVPARRRRRRRRRARKPSAPGLAAAQRPESQEACFLAGDDYRDFLGRHGLARRARPDRRRGRTRARLARRLLALHARASAAASASPRREPLYALRTDARDEHGRRSGRARRSRRRRVRARGRLYVDVERVRREAALSLRRRRGDRRRRDDTGFDLAPRRAGVRRRAGPGGGSLRRTTSSSAPASI